MALTLDYLKPTPFDASHGVAAAGSPRRKSWDMFASKPLAPDGAAARFAPFVCTQNLSPPPGLGIIDDSYPHGLRHGLPAVTPTGVKVSAIGLTPKRLIKVKPHRGSTFRLLFERYRDPARSSR